MSKTENIYNTTLEILANAEAKNISSNVAAVEIARQRIADRKKQNLG